VENNFKNEIQKSTALITKISTDIIHRLYETDTTYRRREVRVLAAAITN